MKPKDIWDKKAKGEKIVALTAYDFPTAKILDDLEFDIILVGDSLGMVLLGYETTKEVTMPEMLHHVKAVGRAVKRSLVVADMPFGSYESARTAVSNAQLFLRDADAVKVEGGVHIKEQVEALIQMEIPVMGHVGMTPQTAELLGGYRVQGKNPADAEKIFEDAMLLDQLGVFSMVVECVPSDLAERITKNVRCPTIGIGAGPKTDGQVLVLHDMLGFPGSVQPKFVRKYGRIDEEIRKAASAYRDDVLRGRYPSKEESYS